MIAKKFNCDTFVKLHLCHVFRPDKRLIKMNMLNKYFPLKGIVALLLLFLMGLGIRGIMTFGQSF